MLKGLTEDATKPVVAMRIGLLIVAVLCFAAVPLIVAAQITRGLRIFD